MIITNKGQTWAHGQVVDSLSTLLRELALELATGAPEKARPAVMAATDMVGTLAGLHAGVDALETLVAELREQIVTLDTQLDEKDQQITSLAAQLAAATAGPPDTIRATVRRTIRSTDSLVDAIVESREFVPLSLCPPLAP